ncbi:MAG TPA: DNA repair protein RecO [Blastocatellia bacterium]|nr:DNA repair protein RecO [Blastocatellia bacterium]
MQETTGIVLRSYKLREQDKICVILTKKFGKMRGVFHHPIRRITTNGIYEEPFSEVRLQVYGREGQQLLTFKPIELIESIFQKAVDPRILTFISYAAELFDSFIPEGDPSETHYRLAKALTTSLKQDNIDDLKLYLETWVLKLAGLLPNLQSCGKCRTLLETESWIAADGTPLCRNCGGQYGEYLGAEERSAWASILGSSPGNLPPIAIETRKVLSPILQRLIRRAIEREPNSLRSFSTFEM